MVRTNQGGSVLSFIVIGVVLVLLLVGGAYVVRQQLSQPEPRQSQETDNQSDKNQPQESDKQEQTPQENNQTNSSEQSQPGSNNAAELPQTGPAELFGTLIALGLLTVAVASYVQSRRLRPSL